MKLLALFLTAVSIILLFNTRTEAQEATTIIVRARAVDAKFIGDGMGGAVITILNSATGDTLAHGRTKGDTGDTRRLLTKPVERHERLSTPGAAKFEARINLPKPTLVTIKATANAGQDNAEITSSTQKWIIPGKDIGGDGIILEIPGFVISNQLPAEEKSYKVGQKIPIRTHVVMMCGCPTKPDGLWDSSKYEIKAHIREEKQLMKTVPLSFSGQSSVFEASFTAPSAGKYQVWVYVYDAETGNTGVAKTEITVEQ